MYYCIYESIFAGASTTGKHFRHPHNNNTNTNREENNMIRWIAEYFDSRLLPSHKSKDKGIKCLQIPRDQQRFSDQFTYMSVIFFLKICQMSIF